MTTLFLCDRIYRVLIFRVTPDTEKGTGKIKMKSTGIIRHVDELGRIVIPKEIRKKMDIDNTDLVEIFVDGDKIVLTKYCPACCFCGSDDGITEFKDKKICISCLNELNGIKR